MAATDSTFTINDHKLTFTTADVYQLNPDATEPALFDQLHTRLQQLAALLDNTYGESKEGFQRMGEDCMDNYLWACANMVDECQDLLDAIGRLQLGCLAKRSEVQSAT